MTALDFSDAYEGEAIEPARTPDPPPGYGLMPSYDPFEAAAGPFYARQDDEGRLWLATRFDARHADGETVHEGALMTLADAALGTAAWLANDRAPCVTLSMQTSFLGACPSGALAEAETELSRRTRSILYLRATFFADGEAFMTATSLWKTVDPKKFKG